MSASVAGASAGYQRTATVDGAAPVLGYATAPWRVR